ncbi:MAG: DUF1700 domain-containing protein [Ruminococcus sp.]|nr:DUF1700 domain-containing protein [Ruminococcus sp.]
MTRAEYLAELESNLVSLPKEERDMAVSFYSEYFDEAGEENEQAVIEDLGKPYALARSIIGETSAYSRSEVYLKYKESKPMPQNSTGVFASLKKPGEDLFNTPNDEVFHAAGTPFENVQQDAEDARTNENNANKGMFDDYYRNAGQQDAAPPPPPEYKYNKKSMNPWLIVLIVFAGVFVGIPVLCAVIPAILAIIAAAFVVGAAAICCLVAAIIAFFVGVVRLFTAVPAGLGLIFMAILSAGIGMVLLSGALAFFFKLLPFIVKGIARLFRKRRAA